MGRLYLEHDQWDLTRVEHRQLARRLCDHVVEITDGQDVGWGIMEYGVACGYPRYAEVQGHPPI